jgi:NTE family protein
MRKLLGLLDSGISDEADLASYLLFDGAFARRLIDLGRADAEAQRDQLAAFLA